jgi:hypothetical protein
MYMFYSIGLNTILFIYVHTNVKSSKFEFDTYLTSIAVNLLVSVKI